MKKSCSVDVTGTRSELYFIYNLRCISKNINEIEENFVHISYIQFVHNSYLQFVCSSYLQFVRSLYIQFVHCWYN